MKSVKFMTANEKERILSDFKAFLECFEENNIDDVDKRYNAFTTALYNHFHIHLSYIAAFDKDGFFKTFLLNADDIISFFKTFEENIDVSNTDYTDLNNEMKKAFIEKKYTIYTNLFLLSLKHLKDNIYKAKQEYYEKIQELYRIDVSKF